MTGRKGKNSMLRKLILSASVAGVAMAMGGTAPSWAQDVGVFGEGPGRVCNTVIDSAGKSVLRTGSGAAVQQNGTFACPEQEEVMAAVVEPAAPPPLPDDGQVHFAFDKSNLSPEALAAINDMIFDIKDRELQGIKVVGHTDTVGPQDYNLALSERRAESVAQELVKQGVPVGLITTDGVGMNDLQVQTPPNTPSEANRRAVIQFE
jgi:outer membrane protein OmpA-like peptidoglycan-associated protein